MGNRWPVVISALIVAGCTAQADTTAKPAGPGKAAQTAVAAGQRTPISANCTCTPAIPSTPGGLMATKTTPDDAYRFAKGEGVDYNGKIIRRAWPLDFTAVTDHAENMGLLNGLDDPNSELSKSAVGQEIRKDPSKSFYMLREANQQGRTIPGLDPVGAAKTAWERQVAAANANYKPGKFTTFIAYEWSQMNQGKFNLHRNVIFAGDKAPLPWTSADSPRPEDLWTYLEKNQALGTQALAIPHNATPPTG